MVKAGFLVSVPLAVAAFFVGGLALILFAVVLFLTVVPVSPGGDYIAAGC